MWPAMNFRLLMHNCYRTFLGALVVSCAQEINLLPHEEPTRCLLLPGFIVRLYCRDAYPPLLLSSGILCSYHP